MLLQWAFSSCPKRKVWESAGLPKKMRWKELFECDRPPCSSRGFVQISPNPIACCSKAPCSSRGFGGPCSSRRFGGDFWKVLQHFSGMAKCGQLGCLPRRQKTPRLRASYQQSTGLPPPSRRTGNSALIRRNALVLLGVAFSGREVLLLAAAQGSDKFYRGHICKTDGSTGALLNGQATPDRAVQYRSACVV